MLQDVLRRQWFLRGGEGMIGRDDENEFELSHWLDRQQALGRRIAGRPDHQVGSSAHQGIPAAAQHLHRQADACTRTLAIEILQQGMQALRRHQVIESDAQFALPAGGNAPYAAFQVGRRAQKMASFAQQRLAGFGQTCAVAAAIEQLHVEILLELLDGVGDCRGDAMQFLSGRGEAAVTRDGIQNQKCIQRNSHGGH